MPAVIQCDEKEEVPLAIHGSVGKGGDNFSDDVATVQRLLGLKDTGIVNEGLIEAIEQFQSQHVSRRKKPDGRVDPFPGKTWVALVARTKGLETTVSQGNERVRQRFSNTQSIVISREPQSDDTGKETAEVESVRTALARAPGFRGHEVANVAGGTRVLEGYHDSQTSISNLVISSHGGYNSNYFYVGDTSIESKDIKKLRPWRNLLSDDTRVLVDSCNTGAGKRPQKGIEFTEKLAKELDVTVMTSRSFAIFHADKFNEGYGSWYDDPSTWGEDVTERPNAYKHMGEWVRSAPGQETEIVNSPMYHADGTVTIADERFPELSWYDELAFEQYWKEKK